MENENTAEKPAKKQSHWIFRFMLRVFIFCFILVLLFIGAGFIIGVYYKTEVKEYVIKELNKHLNSEIIVNGNDIDFTVLRNFPKASIDFKNIKALDATTNKNKDTLFKAQEISLQFNLLDIFKKKYRIIFNKKMTKFLLDQIILEKYD